MNKNDIHPSILAALNDETYTPTHGVDRRHRREGYRSALHLWQQGANAVETKRSLRQNGSQGGCLHCVTVYQSSQS